MQDKMFARLQEIYPELVSFRRDLHMYPELSFKEENTAKKVADKLASFGIEVKTGVGGLGVVGYLKGGKPGKTVALRADFDALPIQDEKEVEYKSRIPGVMHACGHDIHTAGLLGVAQVLSEFRDELPGTVVFLHQFAEELPPGGAKSMVEAGCLEGVDVVYGAHVASDLPVGVVGIAKGYVTAAADSFEIVLYGKGGHGASPHTSIDPIVLGSQIVMNLQQVASRQIDPLKQVVLSVCSFNGGGEAYNVIPDQVRLKGTVRTYDEEVRVAVEQSMRRIVEASCQAVGATCEIKYERGYPATWNDEVETPLVEAEAKRLFGEERVIQMPPIMGGEDFAYYAQERPATFFMTGGRNPELLATYPHHHPKFDVDERSMIQTGQLFIGALLAYQARHQE
ncbi:MULTISPECIES: M20 family metallopeptidase [Brevibacillus]|jgi:amidohydrolase|uniref:Putative amidohydrolase YhaA n=1 Tax=Brevibacillus parabrevis TaxID=54914 RepID=A0A4Y3PNN8_BREPA|nr:MULTISPECIES: amidohydrolase [Brevibacillus]MBU8713117.1 amidohydrolase [Brevibacillus parabrevis]RNB96963.1 amidohydrolase [Brevibacillus parabrevis]UED70782.1 amidohydrolase [Brevibacillus sp. HD3.3A]GEB33596.1 putative amidohydrolase YhaA [Brevibacillus parabrevis]